jgi:hypothetical protein
VSFRRGIHQNWPNYIFITADQPLPPKRLRTSRTQQQQENEDFRQSAAEVGGRTFPAVFSLSKVYISFVHEFNEQLIKLRTFEKASYLLVVLVVIPLLLLCRIANEDD